jgi:acyl-CoA synthetase (AMP-forming)/AMP-acid ligase II
MLKVAHEAAPRAPLDDAVRARSAGLASWFLLEALSAHTAERPDDIALTFLDSRGRTVSEVTYAGLLRAADAAARTIRARSDPGERVILCLPTGPDYVVTFLGCLLAGIVAVPLYPPANSKHLPRIRSVAANSGARLMLTSLGEHERLLGMAGSEDPLGLELVVVEPISADQCGDCGSLPLVSPANPDSIAFLQYTSGSTGDPKGVMISHRNLAASAELSHPRFLGDLRGPGVSWLPLYHDMGLIGALMQSLIWGDHLVLMAPTSFAQRPLVWLEAISRFGALRTGAPNFALDMCSNALASRPDVQLDLSSLRVMFCGAEPIRPATLRRFFDAFEGFGLDPAAFMPCYGLAEATLFVSGRTWQGRAKEKLLAPEGGSIGCGPPADETRVAIVCPETAAPLPAGEVGEIWVSGPQVADGYWRRPELTERVFRASIAGEEGEAQTYLRTGDLGAIVDGELSIRGRTKEMLILNGRNHYPGDLENTAASHCDAIQQGHAVAVAIEGKTGTSLALVAEVTRSALDEDLEEGVKAIRRALTAAHGIAPQTIVFLRRGTLPKTSSGKLRRVEVAHRINDLIMTARHTWRAI